VGVLVSNIVAKGHVRVSQQGSLLDEVRHGILVTLGADIQGRLVRRSGGVRPGPFFPVSLGLVDGP
jgi:hypothetical protein